MNGFTTETETVKLLVEVLRKDAVKRGYKSFTACYLVGYFAELLVLLMIEFPEIQSLIIKKIAEIEK